MKNLVYSKFPVLVVCHEKHNDQYYLAGTQSGLERIALEILSQRLDDGYMEGSDERRGYTVLDSNDGSAALKLLKSRNSFEYESIDFIPLDVHE